MVERKQVVPGDVITRGNQRYGPNIEKIGDDLVALRIGLAEVSRDEVRLNPASGPYLPRPDDEVIGKVVDINGFGWVVDINSCFDGFLPASFVFGREFSPATHDLSSKFRVGDLLGVRIESFERSRDPQLSIRGHGYGRIESGEIVKMSPTRVPRLIGRGGAMINMVSEKTGCDIKVGQNGVVVVTGGDEGVAKAVSVINMIERDSQSAELMQRIQEFLGVSEAGA